MDYYNFLLKYILYLKISVIFFHDLFGICYFGGNIVKGCKKLCSSGYIGIFRKGGTI